MARQVLAAQSGLQPWKLKVKKLQEEAWKPQMVFEKLLNKVGTDPSCLPWMSHEASLMNLILILSTAVAKKCEVVREEREDGRTDKCY